MKVYYSLDNIKIENAVATVGSFDGIHKGHLKVLDLLKSSAARCQGHTVVVSFDPHPREILFPHENPIGLITSRDEKIALLEKLGIDYLVIIKFDFEFSSLTYDEFVKNILVDKLKIKGLVVGYDHRFGKGREGSYETLEKLSCEYDFILQKQEAYQENYKESSVNVSSTKIRDALKNGDIERVNSYLQFPYTISGSVVVGDKIGSSIGFPTANIALDDERKILPCYGVYAVKISLDSNIYKGMLNVGVRPTINHSGEERIEVNIFDFEGDIYMSQIGVEFVKRLRGERRFDSLNELCEQMKLDKKEALDIL